MPPGTEGGHPGLACAGACKMDGSNTGATCEECMCGWHCYTLAAKKLSLFVHCADVLSCACRYVPDSAESCAFSASHPYLVLLKFIIMTVYVLVWSMMADFARILNSLHQPCDILLVLRAHILTEISSLQVTLAFALLDAPFSRSLKSTALPANADTCHWHLSS